MLKQDGKTPTLRTIKTADGELKDRTEYPLLTMRDGTQYDGRVRLGPVSGVTAETHEVGDVIQEWDEDGDVVIVAMTERYAYLRMV